MPLLDDMTYTTDRGQVYCNGRYLEGLVRPDWGQRGFLAVSASAHSDFQIGLKRTRTLGSVGASLVYTARGAATAAFLPKARLWDLVAGAAILIRAGGKLRYLSGRPVDYLDLFDGQLAPEPIIAGHPNVLAELQGAIRP
jgi:fructose-1,6-bisphosphatase/inositol monophosphatase family enzyme